MKYVVSDHFADLFHKSSLNDFVTLKKQKTNQKQIQAALAGFVVYEYNVQETFGVHHTTDC